MLRHGEPTESPEASPAPSSAARSVKALLTSRICLARSFRRNSKMVARDALDGNPWAATPPLHGNRPRRHIRRSAAITTRNPTLCTLRQRGYFHRNAERARLGLSYQDPPRTTISAAAWACTLPPLDP